MIDQTPYVVTISTNDHREHHLRNFGSLYRARQHAKRTSQQERGTCIVRGPLEEDNTGQTWLLAIFHMGDEIEDADPS